MTASSAKKGSWIGDVSGGVTACLLAVPEAMAYGALSFAPLGPAYVPAGVASGILALSIANLASAPLAGTPILHSGNYSLSALMLASTVTFAAAALGVHSPVDPEEARALVAILFFTVLLAGLFQIVLGALRFGVLTKYIPHPVFAGLMNGTAIVMLLGLSGTLRSPEAGTLFVAAVTCAVIHFGDRFAKAVPVPFKGLLAGSAAYYLLRAAGFGSTLGPVIGEVPGGVPTPATGLAIFRLVTGDGLPSSIVIGLVPYALGLAVIVSLRTLLACLAADEVSGGRADGSRELIAQGFGNAASAVFGGVASTGSLSRSAANYAYGGRTAFSRVASGVAALVILLALHRLVGAVPAIVLTAMLVMLALSCFDAWSLRLATDLVLRKRASGGQDLVDLAVVAVVTGVMVLVGVFESIGVGIVISILLFVIRMSRDVVRREYDASLVRANVLRSQAERDVLRREGARIRAYELEGALFFGTADQVAETVESLPPTGVTHVILECRRVSFIDSTGFKVLGRLAKRCAERGVSLTVTELPDGADAPPEIATRKSTLDALLSAEDELLRDHFPADRYEQELPLDRSVAVLAFLAQSEIETLQASLDRRSFADGDVVFRAGDRGESLFIVVKGRIRLNVESRNGSGPRSSRLSTLCPGTIMGEMALIDGAPRSAGAVAEGDVVCFELTRSRLERLQSENPAVAIKLLTGVSAEMSTRLRLANEQQQFFARS